MTCTSNIRPPATEAEARALMHAEEFVQELRLVFERFDMNMCSIIAVTPSGLVLTLGDASTWAKEAGVEAIEEQSNRRN